MRLHSHGAAKLFAAAATAFAQAPRASDGHPDLSGIWQAMGTANWDLEDHPAEPGPVYQLGVIGAIPPGRGVVEGGDISYKPEALAQRQENRAERWKNDPLLKCYMPGIPRAAYLPQPFEIVHSSNVILMAYQFASTNRAINMGKPKEASADAWMGTANGRWEGETLVVDNTGFNDQSWLDRSGNYRSDAPHVVERYTPADRDHIRYEATIEDAQVFTRPWKIALRLYRDVDPNATLAEFKGVEFSERMLYSDLSGPGAPPDLILTERFTRVAPNILEYSVTVNDPKTYTAPWTATFPLTSEPGYEIFEYACHEGNYSMRNRLSAARASEAKDVAKDAAKEPAGKK
jgi:hypothetical protein